MQQIAQSHAAQESAVRAQNERNAAQEERIQRLEALLQNMTTGSGSTPEQPRIDAEPEHREKTEVHRPRARLPDPAMFSGSTSEWPSWRMENKINVDGQAIRSPQDQFAEQGLASEKPKLDLASFRLGVLALDVVLGLELILTVFHFFQFGVGGLNECSLLNNVHVVVGSRFSGASILASLRASELAKGSGGPVGGGSAIPLGTESQLTTG
ncbi:hypothetical protein N7532_007900 [Penicillium argentinense]|uniref:Uncharacterized protein n=1 Tax=Penicillium argentinense TaxID=1131581 RepID=A0A9W9EWM3_9EURO|nr:uncharacterized protein N7532_007900 [Penicillium argentinense]KAJ5089216.1 hypothetical protein N7532_007900 [Penicillium argentinense]